MTATFTRPLWFALTGVLAGTAVIFSLAAQSRTADVVTAIRDTQVTNTSTNKNTNRTLHLVRSCVTPGHKCYVDSQRRTGQAVGSINQVVILAAACSVGLPEGLTVAQRAARVKTCVVHALPAQH